MKHMLKIKEEDTFVAKLKNGTFKRKYRFSIKGDKASLKQFKLDILAKKNPAGLIYKDGSLVYYDWISNPSKQSIIIRLGSGRWVQDTSNQDRFADVKLNPEVAKHAGQEIARMLFTLPDPDDDIIDDDDEDLDDEDIFNDEDDFNQEEEEDDLPTGKAPF